MDIIVILLNKLLFIAFFMSILNIIRHILLFRKHMKETEPSPYKITNSQRIYLGLSLAFLLMSIFKNIGL